MTQEDIIHMARDCGINFHQAGWPELERFAKLIAANAAAAEREACAKVAITYDSEPWKHTPAYSHVADMVSVEIGKAIRARGQE
jgi:predicted deacylase